MRAHLYSFLVYPILYFMMSFYNASWNISGWESEQRAGVVIGGTLLLGAINLFIVLARCDDD